jgi:Homing endonuclease associated repeat
MNSTYFPALAVMQKTRYEDPRIPELRKHLKALARRHDRRLVVADYNEYRLSHAGNLPSMTTLYRLFKTWPGVLEAVGIEQEEANETKRTSNEALIEALQTVAKALDVQVLSSHAYDEYRRQHAPHLPSSSVIRKWLGPWGEAVGKAGLETTTRSAPRKPNAKEISHALWRAKQEVDGMLTQRTYSDFYNSLPEEERANWPDVMHIISLFQTWEIALRNADVEQSDELHPSALWTADEARRIMHNLTRVLGRQPNETEYNLLKSKAHKPMPEWDVMMYLLAN